MPSFTTFYRALVMIAAGVIVVKGWQLYGPTAEQSRAFGVRVLEIAQGALNRSQQDAATNRDSLDATDDPRLVAPMSSPATLAGVDPAPPLAPPAAIGPAGDMAAAMLTPIGAFAADEEHAASPAGTEDELSAMLTRLERMGVVDTELSPWGSSGQMYRFHCRAPLGDSPAFVRHFEAVAEEPRAAVEQVLAKVEAWRTAQRERTASR